MQNALPAPLFSVKEEEAFLDEIYRELEASGHVWPELTDAEADELERLDNLKRKGCHEL